MALTETEYALWRVQMHRWMENADEGLVTYIRMREEERVRRWYIAAGLVNLADPLTRHEVDACREEIFRIPGKVAPVRKGPMSWRRREPHTPPKTPATSR